MSLDKLPRLWGRVSQSLPGLSLVIALMIATWMTQTVGAEQPEPDNKPLPIVTLPEAALQAPAALMPEAMPAAGNSKLDDGLIHAAQREQDATVDASPFLEESSLRIADGLVQTRVIATAGEFTEAQRVIAAAGGLVTYSIETDSVMQAWLPLDSLQALAQEASLAYISAPSYAVELNIDTVAAQTEGFAALNGQAWRNVGYDGSGVKIAIIDSSFGGYKNLLGSELPANVTVQNFVDGENNNDIGSSTSVHGTACAEIAADIVPGASFYLIKVSTDLDLAQAVDYAISHGVDVISTSIAWYNVTPGDGSGYFDNLVKQARDNGIIWFTAGGNDRENHWGGEFNDPDGDGFHNFSSTQEVNYYGPGNGGAYQIGPGTLISVFVRWDDWQVTNQDYVLYIGRWNGSTWEIVGSSDRPQNGFFGQRPTESVIGVTTGSSAPYGFFIYRKNSNRNVNLEIFSPKTDRLDKLVPDRSLPNMADAAHAVTLGALGSIQPFVLEEYSSQGPTNGPGGTASGGITKPDFAGYSDVSTESYGFRAFSGTSASAPHGAGAAALVLEAFPGYAAQDVENFLAQQAKDKGAPGKDNVYGFGRLFLGDPPGTPPVLPFNNHLPAVIK